MADAIRTSPSGATVIVDIPVLSVFGRDGDVEAQPGDYSSTLVTNLSNVVGANLTLALNTLSAICGAISTTIAALDTTNIANTSTVAGASTTAALNTLNAALAAAIAALNTSGIANTSGVAGATASAALDTLNAAHVALVATVSQLDSTDIANSSNVSGAAGSVTTALDSLLGSLSSLVETTAMEYVIQAGQVSTNIATSASKLNLGVVYFDPTTFAAGIAHVIFEAVLQTTLATTLARIDLFDLRTNTVVASSELSTSALVPTYLAIDLPALITVPAGLFQARLWLGPTDPTTPFVTCFYSGLRVELA